MYEKIPIYRNMPIFLYINMYLTFYTYENCYAQIKDY